MIGNLLVGSAGSLRAEPGAVRLSLLSCFRCIGVVGDVGGGCLSRGANNNRGKRAKFDTAWNDEHIFPEVINPDAVFLLRRMNEATLHSVNPKRGEVILDIGCGRGFDGVELAKQGAVVIGLEPSDVMIAHAKSYISRNVINMAIIRGVGEYLPFRPQSFDKILCKGALDHFCDPEMVICQIAEVLKPEGKAIIAIANFESLGFRLGRLVWRFRKFFGFRLPQERMPWELPEDHTYRFDYLFLKRLVARHLEVERATGISLLFGLPWWGALLAKCPKNVSLIVLKTLDKIACALPWLSDVVVLRCRTRNKGWHSP